MSEMTEQMQAELNDLKLELKETDDVCEQLQNREKKLMMQLHLCEEREAKLRAKLDLALLALKSVKNHGLVHYEDCPCTCAYDDEEFECECGYQKGETLMNRAIKEIEEVGK